MSIDANKAIELFRKMFGKSPVLIARAPGRVNLIGEHTDYNHGYVLPMAIERDTVIVASPRADSHLRVYAANFDRWAEVDLLHCAYDEREKWVNYVVGVAYELHKLDMPIRGADAVIMGDVPIGSGLSSSASLEMAALVLFECLGGFRLDGPDAAYLGKRVENDFLGVKSGIMDQFIARVGKRDCALFLDCRTNVYEHVPVAFKGALFVIADSGVRRGLAGSKYNERVQECAEAVKAMSEAVTDANVFFLRDFTLDDLESARSRMTDTVYRRARHVITENERTKRACDALRAGRPTDFGVLMNQSDESLRQDYEVTCKELDLLTSIARGIIGCYGARMTGAGFGGCTVNLIAEECVSDFSRCLTETYKAQTGYDANLIFSRPAAGAAQLILGQ